MKTKIPWTTDAGPFIKDSEGFPVCRLTDSHGEVATGRHDHESEAADIARLIAAAPDLLEASKWALAQMVDMESDEHFRQTQADKDTIKTLRAAIAKAEGQEG